MFLFVILASECSKPHKGCGKVRAQGGRKEKQTWTIMAKFFKSSKCEPVGELDLIITDMI